MMSCILHTGITLPLYEKETQLLVSLGTTTKITKPPDQGRAFPWELAMPQGWGWKLAELRAALVVLTSSRGLH